MESEIARRLCPKFDPVAVVFSDSIPESALQFKQGKFGCVLNLFAEASRNGRIAGGSRETIVCSGGRAALGLGFSGLDDDRDHHAAVFSKGLAAARDQEAYQKRMQAARKSWRPLFEFGERRHDSFARAMKWLKDEMPRFQVTTRYVWFVPLEQVGPEDDVLVVIFLVNPVELGGLVTLLGSVTDEADPLRTPPGADCFRIAAYAYPRTDQKAPRAVLGMLNVDGRELMRKRFGDNTLTLALPWPLFELMEREASDSVLELPAWKELRS